jgi:creatinine amidohydrolase
MVLKTVVMAEMTSPEFKERLGEIDTVVVPIGSTEVLGAHGPLGTDAFIAAEAGRRIGERAGCLVAPTIPVGDALELAPWPGTLSIRFDVLKEVYLDLCRSLVRHGARRLFFLNVHMMNMRSVDYCGRTLRKEGILVGQADWWRTAFAAAADVVGSAENACGHGGEVITSVILAVRPDLVDLSRSVNERPKPGLAFHLKGIPTGGGPFYTYPDFTDYCESGGWGDARFATAEKGRIILDRAVERIAAFLTEFMGQPLPQVHE